MRRDHLVWKNPEQCHPHVSEHGTVVEGHLLHIRSVSPWPWTPWTWEQWKTKFCHSFKKFQGERQKLRGEKNITRRWVSSSAFDFPFQCFEIFTVEVYGFLIGFIPRCCAFFEATMNGIVFLVSCLAFPLLVYVADWFCILFLYSKCVLVTRLRSCGGSL